MLKNILTIGIAITLFPLSSGIVTAYVETSAAPPVELVITWHASNFAPSSYQGKTLPLSHSSISAALMALVSGKLVDLSGEKIGWYLNNNFIGGDVGKNTIALPINNTAISLRAEIQNYSVTRTFIAKTISIPIVSPQVVVRAPVPFRIFSGDTVRLFAVPYFFSSAGASAFTVSWTLNGAGAAASANPYAFDLTVPPHATSGDVIAVTASVKSTNPTLDESSEETIPFIYQQ